VTDGLKYGNDVLIDRGKVPQAEEKNFEEKFCGQFGHTSASVGEKMPRKSERLIQSAVENRDRFP